MLAYRPVQQRCRYRRIHAAAQPAYYLRLANLAANRRYRIGNKIAHLPVTGASTYIVKKILEDVVAAWSMRNFRMKLYTEKFAAGVSDRSKGAIGRSPERYKLTAQLIYLVGVAHPDRRSLRQPGKQVTSFDNSQIRSAVFPALGR